MSQPWSPEHEISNEEAIKIIEEQFPVLKPVSLQELGKGFDNSVFLVNEQYVFRFPRRDIAVQLLNTENHLLPLLVNKLAVKIPEPIFFGKATDYYQWPFTGYRHVEGKAPGKLSDDVRFLSAEPLAYFFKELHRFPVEIAKDAGVLGDRFERMNLAKRKGMLIEHIKKADELSLMENTESALEWVNSMGDHITNTEMALVHGDCHIRNILVDENGIISGIIDWGDTHLGNPAIDLSIAYSFLPPEGRGKFFQIYGEVSNEVKKAARFFALYVSVILLLYGNDVQDELLVLCAKESISLSLS